MEGRKFAEGVMSMSAVAAAVLRGVWEQTEAKRTMM
jgi:hypothetical protein